MNIAIWLERAGKAAGDRPAIGHGERVVATYGLFAERAARLAGALQQRYRAAPGERVAIFAGNSPHYLELMYGVWHAGLAIVPINAKLHGVEAAWIIRNAGCRIVFATADLRDAVAPHLAGSDVVEIVAIDGPDYPRLFASEPAPLVEATPDDLAWLFYTSGTTGKPKGAMLTHGALAAASFAYAAEVDPIAAGDPILHAAPMSHGSGLYIMAHVMQHGVNVAPESGGFDAAEIFALGGAWRNMSMFAAPTMIKRLVESPADCDPSMFRTIVWGGAPMYVDDAIRAIDRFGPRFAQIYGQGESPMTITTLPRHEIADRGR